MAGSQVRERLHQAIARQRRLAPKGRRRTAAAKADAAFEAVRRAAGELRDELAKVPDLKLTIEPDGVWIELYDKHFWFGYDAKRRLFVGGEQDTLWMEGGVREETFEWSDADACIEAMIQACARYVALADALAKLRPGG
jgi:hypothetical protein